MKRVYQWVISLVCARGGGGGDGGGGWGNFIACFFVCKYVIFNPYIAVMSVENGQ